MDELNSNEKLIEKIITEFSKTIGMFGLTTLEARLFVFLYLSDEPMTLDEMSEALGKSKTSMSTSMRSLSDLNLVTRVWKKGVRKDLYQANSQLFKSFMSLYINKWIDVASHQKEKLKDIDTMVNEGEQADERANLANRVEDIINFHSQLEQLFKAIKQD